MSTKCRCSPECKAVVVTSGKRYARGHSPVSHTNYEQGAHKIGRTIRKKQETGAYVNAFEGLQHTAASKKRMARSRRRLAKDPQHQEVFNKAMANRSKNNEWRSANRQNLAKATAARTGGAFPHKQSTKRKISRSRRRGIREGRIVPWNRGVHGAQVAWNKGLSKTTDSRGKKYAAGLCKAYLEGRKKPSSRADWRCWYRGPNGRIYMRSGYELGFALWCDKFGYPWTYEKHRFAVGHGSYGPDFYLPKQDIYIDPKGEKHAKQIRKIERFRKQHPNKQLYVLFQENLAAMGVPLDKHERRVFRAA